MLGDGNSSFIERELDKIMNGSEGHQEIECSPNRGDSFQKTEISHTDNRNGPNRQDGLAESIVIVSSEMNARLSQEMNSLMQTQNKRAVCSAVIDR